MINTKRSERGQAMLIMALALVGLLAFAALAIDGGMVYSDRRVAQNAADAAAMSAAAKAALELDKKGINYTNMDCAQAAVGGSNFNTALTNAVLSAKSRAQANGFTVSTTMNPTEGISVTCNSINKGGWKDKSIDFKVRVSIDTKTGFLQLIYPAGEVKNTVEAVSRIRPRSPWAFGFAIASIGQDCGQNDGGTFFDGTADTVVIGGGVYSNSCLDKNGGSGSVTVDACDPPGSSCGKPAVGIASLEEPSGHTEKFSPEAVWLKTGTPLPAFIDPVPDCGALDEKEVDSNTISSGIYDGFMLNGSDTLTMEPGLYCFDGDIKMTGGTLTGTGVTIVMRTGSITITGGKAALSASNEEEPENHALTGLVVFMPKTNSGGLTMVGDGGSAYLGTIYAPNGSIDVGGNGAVQPTYNTQLVGKVVKVHGTAQIKIFFDQVYEFEQKPLAELNQ